MQASGERVCRHCGPTDVVMRARGLCGRCYYDPAIRQMYHGSRSTTRREWTTAEVKKVVELRTLKVPVAEIARRMGRTPLSVNMLCHREGLRNHVRDPRRAAMVPKLHAEGLSDEQMAVRLKCTRMAVSRWRAVLGLPPAVGRSEGARRSMAKSLRLYGQIRKPVEVEDGRTLRRNTTPLTDAQRDVAETGIDRAKSIAGRESARTPWLSDDIHSAAMEGLVEAARAFDPSLGVKFATFATPRIVGAIKDWRRGEECLGFRRSDQCGEAPGRSSDGIETVEAEGGEPDDSADAVMGMTKALPPDERKAVRMHFVLGYTLERLGKTLGVSESRASQIVTSALKRLRKEASV